MADPDNRRDDTGREPVIGIDDPEFAAIAAQVEAHADDHGKEDD